MTTVAFHDIRGYMAPKQMAKPDAETLRLPQVAQKIQEPKPETVSYTHLTLPTIE